MASIIRDDAVLPTTNTVSVHTARAHQLGSLHRMLHVLAVPVASWHSFFFYKISLISNQMEVDMDLLISLVQQKSVIWDKTSVLYKNRDETKKAWTEIFQQVVINFDILEDEVKKKVGKEVMKKWVNVRDAFHKSCKKQKLSALLGSGAASPGTYIYDAQLQFLKKLYQETDNLHPTTPGLSHYNPSAQDSEHALQNDSVTMMKNSDEDDTGDSFCEGVNNFKTPQFRKRKLDPKTIVVTDIVDEQENEDSIGEQGKHMQPKFHRNTIEPIEIEMLKILKEKPDRHLSFFQGIIPSLRNFDDDEVLEFQMKVLEAIREIRKRKRHVLTDQPSCSSAPTVIKTETSPESTFY